MYSIVKAPNPVLLCVAKNVNKVDTSISDLVLKMTKTLEHAKDPEGVGLAAPQVGVPLKIFIIKESSKSKVLVFINPKIVSFKDKVRKNRARKKEIDLEKNDDVKLEGCLSLQDFWGIVKRHDFITLSYMDIDGKKHQEEFSGFLATIIQHECDHLAGILFPQRVLEQKGTLYKSKKDDKGETVFEEISI